MGNGPSKQPDRKPGDKTNNNGNSFIVDDYGEDDGYDYGARPRTVSEGWDNSTSEIPLEIADKDLARLVIKKDDKSPETPDDEKTVPVVVRWNEPAKTGKQKVFVICSYDEWKTKHNLIAESHDERSNSKHDSVYLTILNLPKGEHMYRYIVDGKETINKNERVTKDEKDRLCNIIKVGKADFEAFDALQMDGETGPDNEYGTIEPKAQNPMEMSRSKNQPPYLPNHLLHKILLNQDTSLACDPSLLPVPNSSQLNHLYALSIREDTLALSATHRFRGKFVTTLLYKPIEPNTNRPRPRPSRL